MHQTNMKISGAQLVVKSLLAENVSTIFAYPGGQAIDLFDALYDQPAIKIVLPRHEQALSHAADGYARSTGNVGVCLVTSGPGATNLVTGIATANYDSTPMVCFTGQVPTHLIGNDAFQEVDTVGIMRNICKYAVSVREREHLGAIIKKAFIIARTGKPGVVVVDIPKDIQRALGSDIYPENVEISGYKPSNSVHAGQIKKVQNALTHAKRPLFLLGGGANIARANKAMLKLVEISGVPVVTTIMGKGIIPTDHNLYIGNVGIHGSCAANAAIHHSDLLISIGTRFNDRITGKIGTFAPDATIIHIDIDPSSISRNITVDIPIVADANDAVDALLKTIMPLHIHDWVNQIAAWEKEYPLGMPYSGLTPQSIIEKIPQYFHNYIVATDVGQNQLWTTQFLPLQRSGQLLTSGGLGTMGFGLPAGIGAKLGNPECDVIVVTGDGGMQMNSQELATAVTERIPITICILNNRCLGNVRQWQQLFYDKRYSCIDLSCQNQEDARLEYTPDFVLLAESYGAKGIRVSEIDEIEPAFRAAKNNSTTPTVIEFIIDPDMNVFPITQPDSQLHDMIFKAECKECQA